MTYTLTHESGASLRGAGWTLAAEIKGHDALTWGKKDHLKTRKHQEILSQRKFRWESTNPHFIESVPIWPISVDALGMKSIDDERAMSQEELLIDAGVLEPNFGPNRNHNEY